MLLFGISTVTGLKHNSDGTILQISKATRQDAIGKEKSKNIFKPSKPDFKNELENEDMDIIKNIYKNAAPAETEEPVLLGLRSGFQNVVDTINIEKSNSKNKGGQMCLNLEDALTSNSEIDASVRNYAFVASCNKQNFKNSGCYLKCQKGTAVINTKPSRSMGEFSKARNAFLILCNPMI